MICKQGHRQGRQQVTCGTHCTLQHRVSEATVSCVPPSPAGCPLRVLPTLVGLTASLYWIRTPWSRYEAPGLKRLGVHPQATSVSVPARAAAPRRQCHGQHFDCLRETAGLSADDGGQAATRRGRCAEVECCFSVPATCYSMACIAACSSNGARPVAAGHRRWRHQPAWQEGSG